MSDRTKLTVTPDQPISPEEDPELQAIEAMEVKSIDLDAPKPPVTPPTPPKPVVVEQAPLVKSPTPESKPKRSPELPIQKSQPVTPSEAIADVIAHSPALHTGFHPFRNQTRSRKALILIIGAIVLVGLCAGGYLIIQTLGRS